MSNPVYECLDANKQLVSTHSSIEGALKDYTNILKVIFINCKSSNSSESKLLSNMSEINEYIKMLSSERYWDSQFDKAMTEQKKDAINPSHYKAYIETEKDVLQWLEAMQYLPRFRNPESFKAAVELQARKYLDRNGGKDAELQELQKGLWYFKFLVAYTKNGDKPIRVENIDKILNG